MHSLVFRAPWIILLLFILQSTYAQIGRGTSVRPVQRTSVVVMVGITNPQTHGALQEFWQNGPGGAAEFRIHLGRSFSVGAGGEMSLLYFDEAAFVARYPGVPIKTKENLFVGNMYMDVAYVPFPFLVSQPYIKAQIGAVFITEAVYRQVVAGVRRTYYNVGGTARLTLGISTGVAWVVSGRLSLLADVKALYVHHDRAVGLLLHGRGGIQYKF